MSRYFFSAAACLLVGCSSSIIDRGDGTYISYSRSYTTLEPAALVRARATSEANTFCARQDKEGRVVDERHVQGGIPMDRAAIANLVFECVPRKAPK